MTVRESLVFFAGAIAALSAGAGVVFAQCGTAPFPNPVTCTSTGTVKLSDNDIVPQPLKATNGYPTSFTIPSTVTGTISNIVVRLNGLTASATGQGGADQGISSLGLLLVHGSTNLEILYSPGDANEDFSNVTFYISDAEVSGVTIANTFGFMPPLDHSRCRSPAARPETIYRIPRATISRSTPSRAAQLPSPAPPNLRPSC